MSNVLRFVDSGSLGHLAMEKELATWWKARIRTSSCRGFVTQWLEHANRIRKTLGLIPSVAALCFFVWSDCQFFYICRSWKRTEFDLLFFSCLQLYTLPFSCSVSRQATDAVKGDFSPVLSERSNLHTCFRVQILGTKDENLTDLKTLKINLPWYSHFSIVPILNCTKFFFFFSKYEFLDSTYKKRRSRLKAYSTVREIPRSRYSHVTTKQHLRACKLFRHTISMHSRTRAPAKLVSTTMDFRAFVAKAQYLTMRHTSVPWYTEENFSFQKKQRIFPRPYLRNDTMDFHF